MASSYARLTPMQVLGPTLMVSRSILVARAGIRARLMSVTYARGLIRLQNSTKTRPIAARCSGAGPVEPGKNYHAVRTS